MPSLWLRVSRLGEGRSRALAVLHHSFIFFFPLFFPFPAATLIFGARGPSWAGQRRVALPFPSLYFFGAKTGLRSPSGTKQTR